MAHMIDTMMSVRETPWHGLGTVTGDYPGSWQAARELAGLSWDPIEVPVYDVAGIDEEARPTYRRLDGFKGIARSDTGHMLHVARDSYHVIDHTAMGRIVEAILEIDGVAWETAGSLEGGRRVWALARLGDGYTVQNDFSPHLPYLLLVNAHDGSSACRVVQTTVRAVCSNTIKAAEVESRRTGYGYSIRHTKSWREQINEAREAVMQARREHEISMRAMDELAHIYVTPSQTEEFVQSLIPSPPEHLITPRVRRNVDVAREEVLTVLRSATTAPIAHTAYGLYSAATEWADHVRPARSAETAFGRSMLRASDVKARAYKTVKHLIDA